VFNERQKSEDVAAEQLLETATASLEIAVSEEGRAVLYLQAAYLVTENSTGFSPRRVGEMCRLLFGIPTIDHPGFYLLQ
jgi:hypothetical protein